MDVEEIGLLLTSDFGLIPDQAERGSGKTYFLAQIDWHPSSTTRIVQLLLDQNRNIARVKKLVSSDNNNSVFIEEPLSLSNLRDEVAKEIELFLSKERG